MAYFFRKRSTIHLPITLSVSLMALNVTLMVCWIVLLAQRASWGTLTIGVVAFTLILAGLSVWLVLTIKEIALNNRQANFVDSVTHELKSPIAALQLYLETLRLRHLDEERRNEFHAIMERELQRLDKLINQLLEVGQLDALGDNDEPQEIELSEFVNQHIEQVSVQREVDRDETFKVDIPECTVIGRKIVFDLIFGNLVDNAVKYAGTPPRVEIEAKPIGKNRVRIAFTNNGSGVPAEERKKIFQVFYRGGSELERRQKGTGLGLYIVSTLVKKIHGRINVQDRADGDPGCTFIVEIPGRVDQPEKSKADAA